jgi:hypothetical protein
LKCHFQFSKKGSFSIKGRRHSLVCFWAKNGGNVTTSQGPKVVNSPKFRSNWTFGDVQDKKIIVDIGLKTRKSKKKSILFWTLTVGAIE